MPEALPAGAARGGARGTESDPGSATATGSGTRPGADPAGPKPEERGTTEGTSRPRATPTETSRSNQADSEQLDIPDTQERASSSDAPMPEAIEITAPLAPLLGYWQQVDAATNAADFAPGGFDLSLLAIRPTQRSMQVYRAWGAPPEAIVIAAELRATFDPAGTVHIEEAPTQPSRFPTAPIELPARADVGARTVAPPARPLPTDTTWSFDANDRLRFDGRLYRRIDRAEFDRLGRASAAARPTATPNTPAASPAGAAPARPAAPAGGVDFFGARVKGRYICFVCDISGSMMGEKLERLKAEIIRTIQALPKGSHVQVTFFNNEALVLVQGWTRTGTTACDSLLRRIDGVGCGGGTDPIDALGFAFQLDPVPHELFLLTDGHFERDPAPTLAQLNGGADRTRVHTLGMGDDADQEALEAMAKAHGGTYTHVPATPVIVPIP